MNPNTSKILIISVTGLIILRIFSLLLIPYLPHLQQFKISNLPSQVGQFKYSDRFSAIHEGDDTSYYDMAKMIYDFDFKEDATMLGYSLMIVPFIFVFGQSYSDIFFPLIIFNGIFLFSLTLILLVWSCFLIFKKTAPAVLSGVLFLLLPFIFYVFRGYGPQFPTMAWNDINFMNINWLAAMTDEPAVFFTMLILFLLLIAGRKKFGMFFYSIVGFLAGFSAMIRVTNVVIAIAAGLVIFLCEADKKYRKLFFYGLSAFLGFLPQFLYNTVFFGSPISFGYQLEYRAGWLVGEPQKNFMWSFGYFFHLFSRAVDYSWLAIPVFLMTFTLMILGILRILKINRCHALIAGLWFFLPIFIYMFFRTGQTAMRYYMPAVPAFVILSIGALGWISEKLKRNYCKPDFLVEQTE